MQTSPDAPDEDPTAAAVDAHADGLGAEHDDPAHPAYRQPPAGAVVERPTDDDLASIAALYDRAAPRAADGTAGSGALRTARDLRRTWDRRRNDALLVRRAGADAAGDVVGYLEFDEQLDPWTPCIEAYAEGRVDPAAKGIGIGAFLLGRARDRARRAVAANPELPVVFRTTLVDPEPSTVTWFLDRGLADERHLLQLRIDLTADLPTPEWPAGTRAARVGELDLEAVHDALVAAFADHHLGASDDFATWERVVVERGRVQPWASVAALDAEGTVVGVALGHLGGDGDPGLGVVAELGVVPQWRGRGLATALLRAAFQHFAGLGVQRVGLEVDDVTLDGALRLYQRAGMEVVHHTVVLRDDLPARTGPDSPAGAGPDVAADVSDGRQPGDVDGG